MAGPDQQPQEPQRSTGAKAGARAAGAGRSTAAAILLVFTCLLVPLSVVAVWVHDIALDTDRYVSTMAPLARDAAIRDATVNRITRAVDVRVDGPQVASDVADWLVRQGLPPRAGAGIAALGPQLDAAVNQTVTKVAGNVVRSDTFADVWTAANRAAHSTVVKVLTGEGRGSVSVTDGTVTLDVGAAVEQVKTQLVAAGLSPAAAIPSVDKQMVLIQSDQLATFRGAAHLLDVMGNWLPLITAVIGAAGVLLAHRHRRALAATAWGSAAACLVILIGLVIARRYYLDHLPAQVQSPAAAAAVFDTLLRFLKLSLRMVLVLGVVVALSAYLTGSGRLPRAVRRTAERGADTVAGWGDSHGVRAGSAGRWTAANRGWVTVVVLLVLALGFAVWDHPTAWVVVLMVGLLLVALMVIALLAATGRVAAADEKRGGD